MTCLELEPLPLGVGRIEILLELLELVGQAEVLGAAEGVLQVIHLFLLENVDIFIYGRIYIEVKIIIKLRPKSLNDPPSHVP